MKTTVYTPKDFTVGQWSGGTTTQLYISPATAKYADLDFDIRISSAKVEANTSTFTPLPKVHRQLMVLEGNICLQHKDHYTKQMAPFDVDTFQGDWHTTSVGQCVDFNVMTTRNRQSELYMSALLSEQSETIIIDHPWQQLFLYVLQGYLSVDIASKTYQLPAKHLLAAEAINGHTIQLLAKEDSRVVIVKTE